MPPAHELGRTWRKLNVTRMQASARAPGPVQPGQPNGLVRGDLRDQPDHAGSLQI